MKKQLLILTLVCVGLNLTAQWTSVPITGNNSDVTEMFVFGEDLMVGTYGDGIFKTTDNGETWTNISGDLPNLNVKDIRGGGGPEVVFVATDDGAYITIDHATYSNCTSPALPVSDLNFFWFADGGPQNLFDFSIGTNGGGIFVSDDETGPWVAKNNGLSGDALIVHDIAGYSDDEIDFAIIGTDGGVYTSEDWMDSWQPKNNGLTGDKLHVNRVGGLSTLLMIVTDGGFLYSLDFGDNWSPIADNLKFNDMLVAPIGPSINIYAVGEAFYFTNDFVNWHSIDITGLEGEISCIAQNSTHVFLGTSSDGKSPLSGGMYRKPIDQLITGVPDFSMELNQIKLEQNFPNPCNNITTVKFTTEFPAEFSIEISDVAGKAVLKEILNAHKGTNQINVGTTSLQDGLYFYSLKSDGQILQTRKMMVKH